MRTPTAVHVRDLTDAVFPLERKHFCILLNVSKRQMSRLIQTGKFPPADIVENRSKKSWSPGLYMTVPIVRRRLGLEPIPNGRGPWQGHEPRPQTRG